MLTKKSEICLQGARRAHNQANSQFILTVREEDRRDKILEDVFLSSTEENPYLKRIEASVALCAAVADEKKRQQIKARRKMIQRGADPNFRQLEYSLRAAYIAKSVAAQNYEAHQMKIKEKAKVHQENQGLANCRLANQDYEIHTKTLEREIKESLKRDLQEQMACTLAKRQREIESIMEDKRNMDDAVQKYRDDLMKYQQDVQQKKKKVKKEMDDFEEVQAKWRDDHKNDYVEERRRYDELTQQRSDGRIKFVQEQKQMRIKKMLDHEEIGKKNQKVVEQERNGFDVLIELLIDERKAKEDMQEARENENKKIHRVNFRNEQIQLRELKERQRQEEKKHDDELYREEMRFLAERDALQRTEDEKKMKETKTHREALLNALSEKKRLKVKEMKRLIVDDSALNETIKRRARSIANDRITFIGQHSNAVKGFLHRDVAREGNRSLI